jgi:hypothetical protein
MILSKNDIHKSERIKELAMSEKHDYNSLVLRLSEFKKIGWGKLNRILFIKYNQDLDLNRATELLFENPDWKPQEKEFRQHQIDMHEEALGYTKSQFSIYKNRLTLWFSNKFLSK